MTKITKKQVKSQHFSKEMLKSLDDNKPKLSMMILAFAVVENCFSGKYMFRTHAMEQRLKNHGVLPKSFFRESFLRCTKLMELIKINNIDIDELLEKVVNSDILEEITLFDRKQEKTFYKLAKGESDVN